MKKGLILINAYSTLSSSLNQSNRLKEELTKLGVSVDIKNNDYFQCYVKDNKITGGFDYDFCIYLDKDKYISDMLEKQGIKLFNSHQAISDCDDKMVTYIRLANNGINVVDTLPGLLCYDKDEPIKDEVVKRVEQTFGYPVIVKECYGSLGKGVYKCDNHKELVDTMNKLKMLPHLFQRFISASSGKDIRLIVVGGKCVAGMLRESKVDFRSNIELGGVGSKIEITDKLKDIANKVTTVLHLDYAGIDLLVEDDKYIVCEVNSNAFFGGIEKVTGVNVAKIYAKYIVNKIYN